MDKPEVQYGLYIDYIKKNQLEVAKELCETFPSHKPGGIQYEKEIHHGDHFWLCLTIKAYCNPSQRPPILNIYQHFLGLLTSNPHSGLTCEIHICEDQPVEWWRFHVQDDQGVIAEKLMTTFLQVDFHAMHFPWVGHLEEVSTNQRHLH